MISALKNPDVSVISTDLYPQPQAHKLAGTYTPVQCDVLTLMPDNTQVYTMFNAFHHFTDEQKKQITNRMIEHKAPFLFAEILEPALLSMFTVIMASIGGTLVFTPFIKPFSWQRLLLTYIIPVNIMTVLIDGIISVFRATNASKLRQLYSREIGNHTITVDRKFNFPVFVTSIRSNY